jgi:hypothetical protein
MMFFKSRLVSVERGVVRLDGAQAGSRGHMIFLTVPSQTRVRCFVDGNLVAEGTVGESLLIHDGKVKPEPVRNLSTAKMRLSRP